MFKNKGVKLVEKQAVVEPKVLNPLVHTVDVNMAITRRRLLRNKCLKIESQSRRSLLLTGKKSRDYNNLLLRLFRRCK
jgi:hypothetical protein